MAANNDTATPPNIVYILADDLGIGDLPAYNADSRIPTPEIDRLAHEGVRFTDAHAPSSVCTPSRYALLTGEYSWRTRLKYGVLWPWDPPLIAPEKRTVADLLRSVGYRTHCLGKWHLGWEWSTTDGRPANDGARYGESDRQARLDRAPYIDYAQPLRGGPVDHGFDTHFGVDVPNFPPYTWFEGDRITEPPTVPKPHDMFGFPGEMLPEWELEAMIPEFVRRARATIEASGPEPFFLYFALTSPHTPVCPNKEFHGISGAGRYGDFVCELDWVLGEVREALEAKGIAENTLIVLTSDNGPEANGEADGGAYERIRRHHHYSMGGWRGVKRDTWEGGHRVPFLAAWPGVIPPGTTCDALVSLGDLFATCAELTGAETRPGDAPDSVSMLPLLRDPAAPARRAEAVHHSRKGRFALRQGDWVLIDYPTGDDHAMEPDWLKEERGYRPHDQPGELYNLREDPAERSNRYADHPDKVEAMRARLGEIRGPDVSRPAGGQAAPE